MPKYKYAAYALEDSVTLMRPFTPMRPIDLLGEFFRHHDFDYCSQPKLQFPSSAAVLISVETANLLLSTIMTARLPPSPCPATKVCNQHEWLAPSSRYLPTKARDYQLTSSLLLLMKSIKTFPRCCHLPLSNPLISFPLICFSRDCHAP